MPVVEVVVPDGLRAGELLSIETADGETHSVALPPGYSAGCVLPVELPSLPPSPNVHKAPSISGVMNYDIIVPDNVAEGDIFAVETACGVFDVECPVGCKAGSAITVALPANEQQEAPQEPEPDSAAGSGHRYKPGQRVQVLRTDGS